MKLSFCILIATGACAIAATILAWAWGGRQEDVGSAVGGAVGFLLANALAAGMMPESRGGDLRCDDDLESGSVELSLAYGVFAICYFAFVGWLAGCIHDHGEFAGMICGGLGG